MSTQLLQSTDAAYNASDSNELGLQVSFAEGLSGRWLAHTFDTELSNLFAGFFLRNDSAVGGSVRIAGGHDAAGMASWWLDYDSDLHSLTAEVVAGQSVQVELDPEQPWQAVGVMVDSLAGAMSIYVDGELVDSVVLPDDIETKSCWIGGAVKEELLVGNLSMDQWVLADEPTPPIFAEQTDTFVNTASRWLVVYNSADPDADVWAEAYRLARGVPAINVVGLALSLDETISQADYRDLETAIDSYIDANGLAEMIDGLLLGYRVPGYIDDPILGYKQPIASKIAINVPHYSPMMNEHAVDGHPVRLTHESLAGRRLTARMDAPDLSSALALIARSTSISEQVLDQTSLIYLDAATGPASYLQTITDSMVGWFESLDRMRLRLPTILSGDPQSQPGANFSSIEQDAFFWGWATPQPAVDLYSESAGPRVVSVGFFQPGSDADTVRDASANNWITAPLSAGYAAAIAGSHNFSTSAVPLARPFFEALRQGWTLAEAWYVSQPSLRDAMYLVGDPLLTVSFDRKGWDVFGPLQRLSDIDPAKPMAALPLAEISYELKGSLTPGVGEPSLYFVRRVDEYGRSEAGFRPLRVSANGTTPAQPAWPDRKNWALVLAGSEAAAKLYFARSFHESDVATIELWDDLGVEIRQIDFDQKFHSVKTSVELTTTPTRYRWRVVSSAGDEVVSPWSQPVSLSGYELVPLEVQEVV